MFTVRALAFGLVSLAVVACSSSSSSPTSGGSGGGGGGTGTDAGSGGGGGGGGGGANCGKATCDSTKQYCVLTASTDAKGNVSWSPDHCASLPSGCTLPPSDESTCSMNPMMCDPSSFCDCVNKADTGCKNLSVQITQCSESGSLVGVGCTSG